MKYELISPIDVDWNKDYAIGYLTPNNRNGLAYALSGFGIEVFKSALHIRDFKGFERSYKNPPSDAIKKSDTQKYKENYDLALPFLKEQLIDDIKIIVCFENFMKAVLVNKGMLAHLVANESPYKQLSKAQKSRPIKLSEILAKEPFQDKPDSKDRIKVYHPALFRNTISMSWLLKDGYQDVLKLPSIVFETLKRINERRNKLHLLIYYHLIVDEYSVKQYRELIRYVKDILLPFENRMKVTNIEYK